MAGFYPDVPGQQIMYDRDGSIGFWISSVNAITQLTGPELTALNSDSEDAGHTVAQQQQFRKLGIVFAELWDLSGYFIGGDEEDPGDWQTLETSVDTTNGLDGTWVILQLGDLVTYPAVHPGFRSGIQLATASGIKGVKFYIQTTGTGETHSINAFHLYGTRTAGQTPDRLRFWHPTLDQELGAAGLDFGDRARSTTQTKTFRVKNNSATLTANSITISREALYDPAPAVLSLITIDNAGSGYATSQNIGNLAAGAISGIITVKLELDSAARLGLGRQRIKASAASWS